MNLEQIPDDKTWDEVLEALSSLGNLTRFYRLPRPEMQKIMRQHAKEATTNLSLVFKLTQQEKKLERDAYLRRLEENEVFAMLMILGRSMKCWVETESQHPKLNKRWKIASA